MSFERPSRVRFHVFAYRLPAFVALMLALPHAQAFAQCGATVSACRQCHEIDKQGPVLADGTPWHKDHAFGDFCAECHGGDPTAKDAASAHAELVDPLGDIGARCGTAMCHGTKAQALAAGYRRPAKPAPGALAPPNAPRPSAPPPSSAPPAATHNAAAAAVAVALAVLGGAYIAWNERRRRAAEAKP